MSEQRRNLVIEQIAEGQAAQGRESKLRAALRALLCALDQQWLDGRAPGSYHYSGNVGSAMGYARSLVTVPVEPVDVPSEDNARSCR